MIQRTFTECLCTIDEVPPSREDMEVIGVFNPGVEDVGDQTVLLIRVAERPKANRTGYTPLPRAEPGGKIVFDWFADDEIEWIEPRVVLIKGTGLIRLPFISYIGVYWSSDGRTLYPAASRGAAFRPLYDYEEFGVEDARITRIGEDYWITYVAVSNHGPATALASTRDFQNFKRHGIIFQPENKDVVIFPEKIDGRYAALHRPVGGAKFTNPEMWLAHSPDMIHWGGHQHLRKGGLGWESTKIGAGAPPIRLDQGWLEIYHGVARTGDDLVGVYEAGAMLLDLDDPSRTTAITKEPIFTAEEDFEKRGFVPDVVFPTGVVRRGDELLVYYGAADAAVGVVGLRLPDILDSLG
jgi:predicted GH43/DUF377 family glycosyl hydrolase